MIEGIVTHVENIYLRLFHLIKKAYLNVRFAGRISISSVNFRSPFYCRVGSQGNISIGRGTFVNYGAKIISHSSITVGTNCLIGPNAGIYDFDHRHVLGDIPFCQQGMDSVPVEIGDNVWIGANAVILKGTHIGSNSVIGAGAVVSGEIPSCSLVYNKKETVICSMDA